MPFALSKKLDTWIVFLARAPAEETTLCTFTSADYSPSNCQLNRVHSPGGYEECSPSSGGTLRTWSGRSGERKRRAIWIVYELGDRVVVGGV